MPKGLGDLATRFFGYMQLRQRQTVRTGELTGALGIGPVQERELLSRLARRRLITRVRRGLYLVPPRIPPSGQWTPGDYLALTTLIEDQGGRYQICGPNAFCRYGWSDQVPNRLYVYNNRLSGERTVGVTAISLIKLTDARLGDTTAFSTPDGLRIVYSSRIRTLVDAVYDWSRFGSLPQAYEWIRRELRQDKQAASRLVQVALRYGNLGTIRRIGWTLETAGVEEALLKRLERRLRPSSALIPYVPTAPKRGFVARRWGVLVNA